jgi:sucrose-6-phosphate hydrolase SacC (GH32 family)
VIVASQQNGLLLDVSADIRLNQKNDKGRFYFRLSNDAGEHYDLGFDIEQSRFYGDRRNAGKMDFSDKFASDIHWTDRYIVESVVNFRILIDKSSIELFVDGGKVVMTDVFFPNEDFSQLSIISEDSEPSISNTQIYTMKSIWE